MSIILMKQDEGREVVLSDKHKYSEKYLALLNTNQFINLHDDPTKAYEAKTQRTLRKMKHKFTNQEYKKLYPPDSNVGRFYGTGKVRNVHENGTINDLPMKPIGVVSNIGAVSYHLDKFKPKSIYCKKYKAVHE